MFTFFKRLGLPLVAIFSIAACKTAPPSATVPVKSWPIVFNEDRSQLSLEYMQEHYGMSPASPTIDPKMVVVHWTAIPTLQASYEAFYGPRLPASRATIGKASLLNVSVPYLIDRDGTIFQLMPDTLFARHVIGLNHCAIGIENVGDGNNHPLTEAQFVANVQLIKQLLTKYNIQYVIGHHEYQQFIGHPLWREKDANYLTKKSDPGDAFMQRVRSELRDYDLLPLPAEDSIQQGISGQVRWYEGNLMPTVGDAPAQQRGKAVQRRVKVYELTHRDQATEESGFFSKIGTKQVATVTTDSLGQFQLSLPVGKYSVLVEEDSGLFANRFDGDGNIAPVEIQADQVTQLDIRVDYQAAY